MEKMIIAVDGPSGAGKSTATKMLAEKLGILQLNTGALYRAVALYCLRNKINPSDESALEKEIENINISIGYSNGNQVTYLNGEDVSDKLYTADVTDASSLSSQVMCVRELILMIQRQAAMEHNLIIEGRDIGSVVLPDANFKFYIDASPEIRAKRRINDEKNKNENLDYNTVLKDIIERDRRDMERKISPLVRLPEAIYINTDNLNIDEVVQFMFNEIKK